MVAARVDRRRPKVEGGERGQEGGRGETLKKVESVKVAEARRALVPLCSKPYNVYLRKHHAESSSYVEPGIVVAVESSTLQAIPLVTDGLESGQSSEDPGRQKSEGRDRDLHPWIKRPFSEQQVPLSPIPNVPGGVGDTTGFFRFTFRCIECSLRIYRLLGVSVQRLMWALGHLVLGLCGWRPGSVA